MDKKVRSILDDIANNPEVEPRSFKDKPKNKSLCCFWEQDNIPRGNWSGRIEFFVTTLGYCLGLGQVWRFPYLCYIYGRAAFFIPFIFFVIILGLPIFLMEFGLGQFCSRGILNCWGYNLLFRGIGIAMLMLSAMVAIYHNAVVGYCLRYLVASMAPELPWSKCRCKSSALCYTRLQMISIANCTAANGLMPYPNNGTCYDSDGNLYGIFNMTRAANLTRTLPADDYFKNEGFMTSMSMGIDDLKWIRWDLALCLLVAWVLVFLFLLTGIRSMAKVAYVTTFLSLLLLFLLFIIGFTHSGHEMGLKALEPDFERLKDPAAWCHAAILVFYLTGSCWGGLITLASFNRFHTDVVRYSLIIPLVCVIVYVIVVLMFFSYLGIVIKEYGSDLTHRTIDSSVVFAFIIVPQGISKLSASVLWAILYFLMLVIFGLGTVMVLVLTILTALTDAFHRLRATKYRIFLTFLICIILFLLGLTMTTVGGMYMLQLLDDYVVWWSIAALALIFIISFMIYGPLRLARDIEVMVKKKFCCCIPFNCCRWFWTMGWLILTPICLLVGVIICLVTFKGTILRGYSYPPWANVIGWLITTSILVAFVIVVLVCCIKNKCKCGKMIRPTVFWGPELLKNRKHITYAEGFVVDPKENQEIPEDMQYNPYDEPSDYAYDNGGSDLRTNL